MTAVSVVETGKGGKMGNSDEKNKSVLITGGTGKFYYVYNDDAFIINYLLGYKILPKLKLGFPDSALNKVIFHLQSFHISYKVIKSNKVIDEKNYKKINNYSKYSMLSKKNADIERRIENIFVKIKLLDKDRLIHVIDQIEECLE